MSKPDDIPQSVWDDACHLCENFEGEQSECEIIGTVARTIMTTKDHERQACIITVLSFIEYGGDTHHGITVNSMVDAMEVAAALRRRGEMV